MSMRVLGGILDSQGWKTTTACGHLGPAPSCAGPFAAGSGTKGRVSPIVWLASRPVFAAGGPIDGASPRLRGRGEWF